MGVPTKTFSAHTCSNNSTAYTNHKTNCRRLPLQNSHLGHPIFFLVLANTHGLLRSVLHPPQYLEEHRVVPRQVHHVHHRLHVIEAVDLHSRALSERANGLRTHFFRSLRCPPTSTTCQFTSSAL